MRANSVLRGGPNGNSLIHISSLIKFKVADEIAEKWSKLPRDSKVPLVEYMSMYTLKAYLHTLYGNLMKDDKDELHFGSEIDEVRNM